MSAQQALSLRPPLPAKLHYWKLKVQFATQEPAVAVPADVVTVMATAPAACVGALAVICVSLFTVKLPAATPPNATALALVKPLPVITTVVLVAAGP